ncbi:hypothetical protein CONCODRAFT_8623 [Conidiobolus coronatus NRRL 28638]|uniref:Sugar phosphate transporter domain-containing protein n=1 Tax=Conidiobolus coronatus (strain ATCC 28846 / CBS 209.66 / NRRL 28638) TaxID=796925 RepID=A0A137P2B7_CONC2|nr:hypothetical protein CONCODRAFT_8623 [Conidiobolus coronatus NRRL 28638]|eukprot:KXN69039.1 hypothetical protein CONCODRAFT_8623 [Conidiobolus coronatus NRRL 28638]
MIDKSPIINREDNAHLIELEELDKYDHKISASDVPSSLAAPNHSSVLFWQFVYLLTGIVSTLVCQWMFYKRATDKSSLLTIAARFFGMVLVQFTPFNSSRDSDILLTFGQFSIGSGIFQVLVSLLIPTTALLSKILLNKKHTALQWWGILCIMVGLALTAMGKISQEEADPLKLHHLLLGGGISIIGILLYSALYVFTEKTMNSPSAPSPNVLCYTLGQYGSSLCLGNYAENESLIGAFVIGFITLVLSALFHNLAYFFLMDTTGAVSIGVLLALKTVGVFVMSGFLFCGTDPSQCLNPGKFTSLIIVVLGVLIFTFSKMLHK